MDRQKFHFNFYFIFENFFTESTNKQTHTEVCKGEALQLQTPASADRGLSNKAAKQEHRSPTFFLGKSELQKQVWELLGTGSTSKKQGPLLQTCETRGTEQLKGFVRHKSWQQRRIGAGEPVTLVPCSAETCFKGNPRALAWQCRQLPVHCLTQGTPQAVLHAAG